MKESLARAQYTPKERCVGRTSWQRSRSQMSLARSPAGSASMTAKEFDTTLWSRKLVVANVLCVVFTNSVTSLSVGREVNPSSSAGKK